MEINIYEFTFQEPLLNGFNISIKFKNFIKQKQTDSFSLWVAWMKLTKT